MGNNANTNASFNCDSMLQWRRKIIQRGIPEIRYRKSWVSPLREIHTETIYDYRHREYRDLEKLINSSRKRFLGVIQLDEDFLKKNIEELNEIKANLYRAQCLLYPDISYPNSVLQRPQLMTKGEIEHILYIFDLYKYKPENYVYPDPLDFPTLQIA